MRVCHSPATSIPCLLSRQEERQAHSKNRLIKSINFNALSSFQQLYKSLCLPRWPMLFIHLPLSSLPVLLIISLLSICHFITTLSTDWVAVQRVTLGCESVMYAIWIFLRGVIKQGSVLACCSTAKQQLGALTAQQAPQRRDWLLIIMSAC